ncbi:endonuclease IV [Mycoplasmopsis californica HAZ160_1]|uniref:Probable endonuclease 4 n=2 Tax=Mycoplasmopsis californica TaxID=2113 RepID=A0A059XRW1_9BACT|nr:deoxyribonuclease IV [Mycoplasmopsis californica]AIA29558.1 endonuclease IV [Mycoplasmopsis californica]BAP00998.1 endonuclease IV [Mycoplasmopsis californica HAZ160_1]BBG40863.1 endonuclease IV [Mycoplasmopsis californica]BBG41457.1 endonuclease IV [Mycoplasmopsis californica]BBG42050.1 endonuclease IV [Mycoplasmopsis californica]
MIKLGSHVPFNSPHYLAGSAQTSINNGANTMMIFVGPPQSTKRVDTSRFQLEKFHAEYADKIAPSDIVVHAPYIINMASVEKGEFAVNFMIEEIKRVNFIGAKYIVLHPGASTKFDITLSLDTLAQNLIKVLENTENVVICLETMAGKGTEVCRNFEQIKYILDRVNNERVQVCLDTCHIWDSGYDLTDYENFKNLLHKSKIMKHIKVIHLNDSLNECGSRKDRHANIGQGKIGLKTLARFVHDKDWKDIPIILETPWTENGPIYDQEIKMLLEYK